MQLQQRMGLGAKPISRRSVKVVAAATLEKV